MLQASKDCTAIIHSAMNMSFGNERSQVVEPVVRGMKGILQAAQQNLSIKRVVFTSSSTSAQNPVSPAKNVTYDGNSWNMESVKLSKSLPSSDPKIG